MKYIIITLIFFTTVAFLTSCNSKNTEKTSFQNTPVINEETSIESSEEEKMITLIAEEVLPDDILSSPTINNETAVELSEYEVSSLIQMREEEKLARDVYLTLYDTRWQKIFSNIAASEQTHTDAVKKLLETYNIEDPVTDNNVWVFQIPAMQELYDTLTTQWNTSLEQALIVGATIEDLDIKDLQDFSQKIANTNILAVYENLERGSRNHMRAFIKNLTKQGVSYTPIYISENYYQEIISGEQERWGGHK